MVWFALAAFGCTSPPESVDQDPVGGVEGEAATEGVPVPTFHHMHINSVDPDASLDWWHTFWPSGTITTVVGFPRVRGRWCVPVVYPGRHAGSRRLPAGPLSVGAAECLLDHRARHGWEGALRAAHGARPRGRPFEFLPVHTGPDDTEGVPHSGLGPFGDQLRTVEEIEALNGVPTERGPDSQDFGCLVDPDGVLVEFNGNAETEDIFYAHTHFWHEHPLCAVDW